MARVNTGQDLVQVLELELHRVTQIEVREEVLEVHHQVVVLEIHLPEILGIQGLVALLMDHLVEKVVVGLLGG